MAKNDTIPCATRGILLHYSGQLVYTRSSAFKLLSSLYTCVCVCTYMSHFICTMHIMEHIGSEPEVM